MIKVILGEKLQEEKPFPKVSKFTYPSGNTCILLMHSPTKATVLHVGKTHSADTVADVWDVDDYPNGFEDYNEPITLQNL